MANQNELNPQQQEALSRIMSVPVNPTPTQSYQVPELTPRMSTPPTTEKGKVSTPNITAAPVTDEKLMKTKSSPVLVIGIVLLLIIGLAGYTFLWLKIFKVI